MNVMSLILGAIPLGVNTVTYNDVGMSYNTNWAKHDRINNSPSRQNTGPDDETMTISGISLPSSSPSALVALEALKEMAASATPQYLFNADGVMHGKWVITGFDQGDKGGGDQNTYSIKLARYQDSSLLEQSKAYVKGLV